MLTLFWNVDDKINLMSKQKIHQCRRFLLNLIDADDIHAGFFQRLLGSSCCINFIAKCFKTFCYRNGICFILVSYRKDHLLVLRKIDTGSHKRFGERFIECLRDSETFTGWFHLRSEADLCAAQFLKGEYRHLDCDIICGWCKSRCVTHSLDGISNDNLGCQVYDWNTGNFTDIWYRSWRTWIYFDNIYLLVHYDKLDINQSYYM